MTAKHPDKVERVVTAALDALEALDFGDRSEALERLRHNRRFCFHCGNGFIEMGRCYCLADC